MFGLASSKIKNKLSFKIVITSFFVVFYEVVISFHFLGPMVNDMQFFFHLDILQTCRKGLDNFKVRFQKDEYLLSSLEINKLRNIPLHVALLVQCTCMAFAGIYIYLYIQVFEKVD